MGSVINIENLSFTYSGKDKNGLKNINIQFNKGEMVLITGRSGCGKTTLTRCINGMIPHFYHGDMKGAISIGGDTVESMQVHDIAFNVGSVFQDPRSQFFATITTNELAFGMENIGTPREVMLQRIAEINQEFCLDHLMNRSIFELSSGEKQKIAIASVCAMDPSIIIFDEPSANIDGDAICELAKKLGELKALGHTIIVVEHRLHYLREYADRIIYMENGMIAEEMTNAQFGMLREKELSERGLRIFNIEELNNKLDKHIYKKAYKNLKGESAKKALSNHSAPSLCIRNLSYKIPGSRNILNGIDLDIYSGETVGIIGKNGAGKTTLINVVSGLKKESSGEIVISGVRTKARKRTNMIYMVMQDSDYQLFTESVEDEIKLGNEKKDNIHLKAKGILSALNLDGFSNRHPASLSGGEKQRVVIGSAVASESDIVILDEPTSGLDFDNMNRISKLVNKMASEDKCVVIVSHDVEFLIRTCKKIIVLDSGKIVDDYRLDKTGVKKLHDFFTRNAMNKPVKLAK